MILIPPCSSVQILHTIRRVSSSARRGRRRQVAADGWQGARVWGDTGAHGEHWTALARADAYSRLGENKQD